MNPSNTEVPGRGYAGVLSRQVAPNTVETIALILKIGTARLSAALRRDLAPHSCEGLMSLLPYEGIVTHARWSGEALWSPLRAVWPAGQRLAREHATFEPKAGDVLLYAGDLSEPEILIPYGTSRFASKAGLLEGNPVLTFDDSLSVLQELGRRALSSGTMPLRIEKL